MHTIGGQTGAVVRGCLPTSRHMRDICRQRRLFDGHWSPRTTFPKPRGASSKHLTVWQRALCTSSREIPFSHIALSEFEEIWLCMLLKSLRTAHVLECAPVLMLLYPQSDVVAGMSSAFFLHAHWCHLEVQVLTFHHTSVHQSRMISH